MLCNNQLFCTRFIVFVTKFVVGPDIFEDRIEEANLLARVNYKMWNVLFIDSPSCMNSRDESNEIR